MTHGCGSSAVAIINSPFGQGRVRAFASVEELSRAVATLPPAMFPVYVIQQQYLRDASR
jgi:hypothetical protein